MLYGCVVGGLRLHRCGDSGVDIAAGDGALGEEALALFGGAVCDFEIGLCLIDVELCLLHVFRDGGLCGGGVGGRGRGDGALGIKRAALEIAVFEGDEQLALVNTRAALDVLGADGSVDTRGNGGLREWSEDGVGGDFFGDGANGGVLGRDGDSSAFGVRFVACGFFAAGDESERERKREEGAGG